jgi:hypothetical protein
MLDKSLTVLQIAPFNQTSFVNTSGLVSFGAFTAVRDEGQGDLDAATCLRFKRVFIFIIIE